MVTHNFIPAFALVSVLERVQGPVTRDGFA